MKAQSPIPDKLYFKIGEVSKILGVKPYVLRYWETEFKEIGPAKSRSKQRLYRRKDVETLLAIKQLLYDEGFTISGARKKVKEFLRGNGNLVVSESQPKKKEQIALEFDGQGGSKKLLKKIQKDLKEIQSILQ